jgi:hypothetical protein
MFANSTAVATKGIPLRRRMLQLLAVILVMLGTTIVAEARMGTSGMSSPTVSSTTTLAPGHNQNHGYAYGTYTPPPYNYGANRPHASSNESGGTVSSNSGGSGTKPIKKPNLQ